MSAFVSVCHTCGGLGKKDGCPKCGKTVEGAVLVKTMQLDLAVDVIPLPYQGKLWTPPDPIPNQSAKWTDFDTKLSRVHNEFLNGRIPKFSLMACAPSKYGKRKFAYSCMQTAAVQGFRVAPLLVASDWRRLYKVSQMNPFYRLYDKYKWDELVAMDIVFVSVDYSEERFDCIDILKNILDTRAGFSKPTFILSDSPLASLSSQWGKDSYNAIYNADPDRDYLRYPVILHRFTD